MTPTTTVFSVIAFLICSIHCEESKVTLKLGTIHGYKQKIYGNDVNIFLGIPYAVSPIGDLRFRRPKPFTQKWNEPLDATKWPKICMQDTLFFEYYSDVSEDCLYLNVWSPVNLGEDFSQYLRPVMVFIHGGGFLFMGSSFKHYNGSVLSSFGDVVVVTMNYRLGAFGFLSSGKTDAPGNVGLYDQALALEWVQENIAYFGGDPERITLFGESAGAVSIGLQLHSPLSQNIRRAIIMSGSLFNDPFLDSVDVAVKKTLELAKLLGCSLEDGVDQVNDAHMKCLRKVDAAEIVRLQMSKQISLHSKSLGKIAFLPIVGEAFVPKKAKEMLKDASIAKKVHLLVGTVANEGFVMLFYLDHLQLTIRVDNFSERLKFFVTKSFIDLSADEMNEILMFYFKGIDNKSDEAKMAYYTALGDIFFNCEQVYFSEFVSKTNDLHQYFYDYVLIDENDNLEICDLHKVCHANELPITFGTVSHPNDIEISKKWIKIFTDFAKSGTVEWPKHGNGSTPYYKFTGNKASDRVLYNFRGDACKLWKPIFEKYY